MSNIYTRKQPERIRYTKTKKITRQKSKYEGKPGTRTRETHVYYILPTITILN